MLPFSPDKNARSASKKASSSSGKSLNNYLYLYFRYLILLVRFFIYLLRYLVSVCVVSECQLMRVTRTQVVISAETFLCSVKCPPERDPNSSNHTQGDVVVAQDQQERKITNAGTNFGGKGEPIRVETCENRHAALYKQ